MPDDFDTVVADRCRAVDDVPVPADMWSRVQFKVLDRIPVQFTDKEASTINPKTPVPTDDRQQPKRILVAALLAAAAVVAIALVAIRKDDPVSPADQPSLAVTVAPTNPGFDTIGAAVKNPLELVQGSATSGADVELFRVTSDAPMYWRLMTLPEFDGRTWRLPSRALSRIDDTADSEPGDRTIRQQLQILGLQGQLLPAAADPIVVTPNTNIRRNPDTDALLKTSDLQPGEQYTIVSEASNVSVDALRVATTDNPPDELFVELPDNVPGVVSDLAIEVTAAATTDFDRLIALQDWLRTEFSYDLTIPASDEPIERFLETRSGFCEQFASTFAVMARTLGIPSRVAVGFTPGELNADGWYSVLGKNSHTWTEIWFDQVGWVAFDATPSRGIPGAEDYTGVAAQQAAP